MCFGRQILCRGYRSILHGHVMRAMETRRVRLQAGRRFLKLIGGRPVLSSFPPPPALNCFPLRLFWLLAFLTGRQSGGFITCGFLDRSYSHVHISCLASRLNWEREVCCWDVCSVSPARNTVIFFSCTHCWDNNMHALNLPRPMIHSLKQKKGSNE